MASTTQKGYNSFRFDSALGGVHTDAAQSVSACQKSLFDTLVAGERAPPPLPPLPVSAEILWISGRGNCKEAIFALENGIFRRKNRPAPAVHAAGDD